jgi:hypothetical protein
VLPDVLLEMILEMVLQRGQKMLQGTILEMLLRPTEIARDRDRQDRARATSAAGFVGLHVGGQGILSRLAASLRSKLLYAYQSVGMVLQNRKAEPCCTQGFARGASRFLHWVGVCDRSVLFGRRGVYKCRSIHICKAAYHSVKNF